MEARMTSPLIEGLRSALEWLKRNDPDDWDLRHRKPRKPKPSPTGVSNPPPAEKRRESEKSDKKQLEDA